MGEQDWLAEQFEEDRARLRTVAYRLLGSLDEADDALQSSWLRLSRTDASIVENMNAWLTTIVARVCLDMLQSRKSRREEPLAHLPETVDEDVVDPEYEAVLTDSVGLALLVVLDKLKPSERVAFVLHDLFDLSFDEIGPIVGRSPAAARQLASRARRRVRGAADLPDDDLARRREMVDAFLAASREGDFAALLRLLDPDVVLSADDHAVQIGASSFLRGAAAVAGTFAGRARAAQRALVNGAPGLIWASGGKPRIVFDFTFKGGKIVKIEMIADPSRLDQLDLTILE